MRVTTTSVVQEYGDGLGRLTLAVSVDGVHCQEVVVCSGFGLEDVQAVQDGTLKLGDLIARNRAKMGNYGKLFNILDGSDENVLGSSIPLNHCYISEYGAIQPGEKLPKDLEVGESTRAEYRMSMTKPTIYRIVRVA